MRKFALLLASSLALLGAAPPTGCDEVGFVGAPERTCPSAHYVTQIECNENGLLLATNTGQRHTRALAPCAGLLRRNPGEPHSIAAEESHEALLINNFPFVFGGRRIFSHGSPTDPIRFSGGISRVSFTENDQILNFEGCHDGQWVSTPVVLERIE